MQHLLTSNDYYYIQLFDKLLVWAFCYFSFLLLWGLPGKRIRKRVEQCTSCVMLWYVHIILNFGRECCKKPQPILSEQGKSTFQSRLFAKEELTYLQPELPITKQTWWMESQNVWVSISCTIMQTTWGSDIHFFKNIFLVKDFFPPSLC